MNERNIFIEALQKSSDAERERYLDIACSDDAGLRRRVAGLLRDAQFAAHHSRARIHRLSQGLGQRLKCFDEIRAAAALEPTQQQKLLLRNEMIAAILLVDVRGAATIDCVDHNANPMLSLTSPATRTAMNLAASPFEALMTGGFCTRFRRSMAIDLRWSSRMTERK